MKEIKMRRGHGWDQSHGWGDRRDIMGGSCKCPQCDYRMMRQAAVPCSSIPCPRCGVPMKESN